MVVSGKSGLVEACGNFSIGPNSDHSSGGLVACPLKRLNVVKPMFGLSRTSSMGLGRTRTVLRCANNVVLKIAMMSNDRTSFMGSSWEDRRASEGKITKRKQEIRGRKICNRKGRKERPPRAQSGTVKRHKTLAGLQDRSAECSFSLRASRDLRVLR